MKSIIIVIVISIFLPLSVSAYTNSIETTEYSIKIVYNNIQGKSNLNLKTLGGFCAWLEFNNKAILFDTGGDYISLLENLQKLNLDINKLDAIFISHPHWDHLYGLPGILRMTSYTAKVFVPQSSHAAILEQIPRAEIVPIENHRQLYPNIWSTGQLEVNYLSTVFSEQSLIIIKMDEIYILTGCSHAGLIKIIKKAKQIFPEKSINLVAGGFHLREHTGHEIMKISRELKELGIKNIAPSHCTGQAAIKFFREEWKDNFKELYLGDEYHF